MRKSIDVDMLLEQISWIDKAHKAEYKDDYGKGWIAGFHSAINMITSLINHLPKIPDIPSYEKDDAGKPYNPIPEEYMYRGSFENGAIRTPAPFTREFDEMKLEEFECPCCGVKNLRLYKSGSDFFGWNYLVGCDNCDWEMPTPPISDNGDAIGEFKSWLEAYTLMGKPRDKLNEDLTAYFYPDGEWREKVLNSWREEYPEYYNKKE